MNTKWYVIRSVQGKEKTVKEQLEAEFKNPEYQDKVKQVVIPMEKILKSRNGKKYATERNYYPGYLLIETEPSIIGELKHLNKSMNFVIGFLGDNTPTPLRQSEVEQILGKIDELSLTDAKLIEQYIIGEKVKIIAGPFSTFLGTVEEINDEKKKLKLSVKVFGRSTPIEIDFNQVKKEN
jgi:transcriptional antiterminator NusG